MRQHAESAAGAPEYGRRDGDRGDVRRPVRRRARGLRGQLRPSATTDLRRAARRSPSRSTASSSSTCGAARSTGDAGADACRGSGTRSSTSGRRRRRSSALACLMLADQGELDLYAPVATVLAGVRRQRQGRHRGPPRDEPHRRAVRAGSEPITVEDALRLGEGDRRCSPPRSRGGSRARRRATTPSPRATSRARSCGGSPARRSASSSPRRSPARSAPTSTSARPPSTTPASPTSIPPSGPLTARRRRPPSSIAVRTLRTLPLDAAVSANTIPWRRAEIPAAGGHGNARSVALIHAPMACGGEANGVRLLSPTGDRPGVRRAVLRQRPRARRRAAPRHRLRPAVPGDADQPQRAGLLLGRLGWLAGDHRPRRPDDVRLRDEQDGRGHRRRHAGRHDPRSLPSYGAARRPELPSPGSSGQTRQARDSVQASRSSAVMRVDDPLDRTSPLAARSQPCGCHSSWPVAWASLSIENQQPEAIARSSSSSGGSSRSGRRVDLDRRAELGAGGEHVVGVERRRRALADHPPGAVAEDVDVRDGDGDAPSARHLLAVHAQLRVDAGDDDVEVGEQVVVEVERAVLDDVDLHAGEDAERRRAPR